MSIIWSQEPAFDADGRDDMMRWLRHRYGTTLHLDHPCDSNDTEFDAELEFTADRDNEYGDNNDGESYHRYLPRTRKGRWPRAAAWYKAMREEHPDISPEVLQEIYREFRNHIFERKPVNDHRNAKVLVTDASCRRSQPRLSRHGTR